MIKPNIDHFNDRRVFVSSEDQPSYQILHFTQTKDGSIYLSWPNFPETSWLFPLVDNDGNPKAAVIDFAKEEKLSIHGNGMGMFRAHNNPTIRPVTIKGNKLLDLGKNEGGVRHLFTVFLKEPDFLPDSPALNRKSDYIINKSEKMIPFVAIFFAIPKTEKGLELNFKAGFNIDEVEIPPKSGWGVIDLRFHNVFWYVYSTLNMDKWPKKHQVFFYDGFMIPVIIGTGLGQLRVEFRPPKYLIEDNKLTVEF